ncbi:Uncharacterised protein [Serratia odorifera]|uniref:Uncharacterized protein n=1 Tax=Serratia odorifera TaxID=618 RepID=A0A447L2J8_SEROD|nr:Uncharacterised protein [Serratia odorifera]
MRWANVRDAPRIWGDLTLYFQLVVKTSWQQVIHRHAPDSESDILTEQLLLMKVTLTQHFGARSFKKGDVAGVIHHTTGIGILIINPDRPSK